VQQEGKLDKVSISCGPPILHESFQDFLWQKRLTGMIFEVVSQDATQNVLAMGVLFSPE
jgi:hypothetical protein